MLKDDWKKFVEVVLNPIIVVLAGLTIYLCYILQNTDKTDGNLSVLLTVAISIFSGVVGNRIHAKTQIHEGEEKLITRGQSAIRGLSIILSGINNFNLRIRDCAKLIEEEKDNRVVLRRNYEEFVDKCIHLQEQTINAIEEWKDIVPDADISKLHQNISKLEREKLSAEERIQILTKELSEAKGDIISTKSKLKEAISERDRTKKELEEQRLHNPISKLPSLSGSPLYFEDDKQVAITIPSGMSEIYGYRSNLNMNNDDNFISVKLNEENKRKKH